VGSKARREQRQEILAGLDAYFARIDAQRMRVSPGSSFSRQRCRAGRLVVAPDKPSSLENGFASGLLQGRELQG
jgi:hypothetical protein